MQILAFTRGTADCQCRANQLFVGGQCVILTLHDDLV
jgi:hypothetical protein